MITSEMFAHSKLLDSLRKFKRIIQPLKKSAAGENVNGETFTYAPIDDILKHIAKPLARCGLDVIQTVTGDIGVCTRLVHASGEWIEDTAIISVKSLDDKGAAITRLRRYSIICLLGLPTVDEQKQPTTGEISVELSSILASVPPEMGSSFVSQMAGKSEAQILVDARRMYSDYARSLRQ